MNSVQATPQTESQAIRVFIVEDDEMIVETTRTALEALGYEITGSTAKGEEAILGVPDADVVLMDINLAGEMDGIEAAAEIRKRFNVPVLFMTALEDEETFKRVAVCEAFGYLLKPFRIRELHVAVQMALFKHRKEVERSILLDKTVGGSVRVLTEILAEIEPASFGRGQKVKEYAVILAGPLQIENAWELEVAALLAQVGFLMLPRSLVQKYRSGVPMVQVEHALLRRMPEFGAELVAQIPNLEKCSEMILYQSKNFDGSGFPVNELNGVEIPLGGRILRVLSDVVRYEMAGSGKAKIMDALQNSKGLYDPAIVKAAIVNIVDAAPTGSKPVMLQDLAIGAVLKAPIESTDGTVLVATGNKISGLALKRLRNFAELTGIKEPIYVECGKPA